jgi:hypothetical protein
MRKLNGLDIHGYVCGILVVMRYSVREQVIIEVKGDILNR